MTDSELILSDNIFLNDVCTYVSGAWGTTSWLDHCVTTQNAHSSITKVTVYDFVTSDHLPHLPS